MARWEEEEAKEERPAALVAERLVAVEMVAEEAAEVDAEEEAGKGRVASAMERQVAASSEEEESCTQSAAAAEERAAETGRARAETEAERE